MTDLVTALTELLTIQAESGKGYMTSDDIEHSMGLAEGKVMRLLHQLDDDGRLEVVRVLRRCIDGRMTSRPAYRLKVEE